MKKIILLLLSAVVLLSLGACQTDFSRPADHVYDAKNDARSCTLDLSGVDLPGTSKTFVFEVKNTSGRDKDYALIALLEGDLPLICEFTPETREETIKSSEGATAKGTIGQNEKHRYLLTVTWPAEGNNHIYIEGTATVTVEGFAQ